MSQCRKECEDCHLTESIGESELACAIGRNQQNKPMVIGLCAD